MTTVDIQQDRRAAVLSDLHQVIATTRDAIDRNQAIVMMAIRYGDARGWQSSARDTTKWLLADRARRRRFAALQRLVYGGAR